MPSSSVRGRTELRTKENRYRKMLEGAANGDPSAQDRLERHRLQQKLYMRKKRRTEKALREAGDPGAVARYKEKQAYWRNHEASERAKREAGDPDALARYEARKAGWRRREARRKARGTLSSSHDHAESTAVPTGEQSEDELDVEDEEDFTSDDDFDYESGGNEELSALVGRRESINRAGKKTTSYADDMNSSSEEDDANTESLVCGSGDDHQPLAETTQGNLQDARPVKQETIKEEPQEGAIHDVLEKPRVEVIDLCDSDDDVKVINVSSRCERMTEFTEARVKQEDEAEKTAASTIRETNNASVATPRDEEQQSKTVESGPAPNASSSGQIGLGTSFRERELRLKQQKLQVRKEELDVEEELLAIEKTNASSV